MTRAEAKTIDLVAGVALIIAAVVLVSHAISESEPLVATAFGYFQTAEC